MLEEMASTASLASGGHDMRIHHLNTGTMCPIGRRLVNGTGSLFERARMVCHCLLIETSDGLALVDTGIGLDDIAAPQRLGRRWVRQTAPRLDPAETAIQQIKAWGYSPGDVRHLLLTHLDRDHAGGMADFPNAKVHVHRREHQMAVLGQPAAPQGRYITEQWKHGPDWKFYGDGGEDWFGFKGVRALGDREPDILMIPLMGWSGRAPAPPVIEAGSGHRRQGARHVSEIQLRNRRDRHRYRQELVPHRGPRSARRNRAAAEVVTRPGRSTARQPATVLNRYGGLRRRASSQSQAPNAWPRRPTDAREIRAPLFEGTEE